MCKNCGLLDRNEKYGKKLPKRVFPLENTAILVSVTFSFTYSYSNEHICTKAMDVTFKNIHQQFAFSKQDEIE